MLNPDNTLTFDDILIVPQKSYLDSRSQPDLGTKIGDVTLDIPIISSPMDSVTAGSMARYMSEIGGVGIVHRFCPISEQVDEVLWAKTSKEERAVGAAVGINGDSWSRTIHLIEAGANPIVLDIAHGHTVAALDRVQRIKSEFPNVSVMSGNIATGEAAKDYVSVGADALRVGLGSGAACTTRVISGIGVPQASALIDVYNETGLWRDKVSIVSDGGCKNSGDIAKAIACGADAVMLGRMLAAFPVAAGDHVYLAEDSEVDLGKVFDSYYAPEGRNALEVFAKGADKIKFDGKLVKKKRYRGMASYSALKQYKGDEDFTVEGEETLIDIDYDYENKMKNIIKGVRASLAYCGSKNIKEFQDKAQLIQISNNALIEGKSRL